MSYKDNKFGQIFPTRTGTPSGAANERQMLDALGGSAGFRKSFQANSDGSTTMLTTKNGMPQFTTTNPSVTTATCDIGMDNGVVDLLSAGAVQDVNSNKAGVLRRTAYVAGHVNTVVADKSPIVDVIHAPNTQGVPPADPATSKAFKENSYGKKMIAVLCPPSIFTGKTRLYVQSLYGRHQEGVSIQLGSNGIEAPCILVNEVKIDTNCGVYYDASDSTHHLIRVDVGATTIYPLVPTACAKKLYPKLLDMSISVENRERIEAYILGQSVPGVPVVIGNNVLSVSSMGYGWHFNWSGTACDMAVTSQVVAEGGGTCNESTHYRIIFTRGQTGQWSNSSSVVSGPTRWVSNISAEPIAYPLWDGTGMRKIGVKLGLASAIAPATFYVFYKRDEPKTCTFSTVLIPGTTSITRSPSYFNPTEPMTMGGDAVDYAVNFANDVVEKRLRCGTEEVMIPSASIKTSSRMESTGPIPMGVSSTAWYSNQQIFNGTVDIDYGRAVPVSPTGTVVVSGVSLPGSYTGLESASGGLVYPTMPVTRGADYQLYAPVFALGSTWTTSVYTRTATTYTSLIAAIPHGDSEAIYFRSSKTETTNDAGDETQRQANAFFWPLGGGLPMQQQPYEIVTTRDITGRPFHWGFVSSTAFSRTTNVPAVIKVVGVSSNGAVTGDEKSAASIRIPTPGAFFDPNKTEVPVVINAAAAASGTAVFCGDTNLDKGNGSANLGGRPFVYVGWA